MTENRLTKQEKIRPTQGNVTGITYSNISITPMKARRDKKRKINEKEQIGVIKT